MFEAASEREQRSPAVKNWALGFIGLALDRKQVQRFNAVYTVEYSTVLALRFNVSKEHSGINMHVFQV